MSDVLEILPEKQKARFRYGQWVKGEGCIYDRFTEEMIIKPEDLPEMEYYTGGQDFGLNIAGVKIRYHEDKIYVVKDHGGVNSRIISRTIPTIFSPENVFGNHDFPVYCDPAGGERIQEITGGIKAKNAVDSGLDYINSLIERERFFISSECSGVLSEIWDYSRDEDDKIIKINDHYMDAVRYAIFSPDQQGVVIG